MKSHSRIWVLVTVLWACCGAASVAAQVVTPSPGIPAPTTPEVFEVFIDPAGAPAPLALLAQQANQGGPVGESGTGSVRINGELVRDKRITIYLWKGDPPRRAAMSGRADENGVWRWRQRPASQGYAPFVIEVGDEIHVLCTNGETVDRKYRIEEVRTNSDGRVTYFRGTQI